MFSIARNTAKNLGGNAILCFAMDTIFFEEGLKNQGYALISISADIVFMVDISVG